MAETAYLVVGQGLAGTVLALHLLERGVSVNVIDNHHQGSSSVVAAGMWNPIVFRKLNKSWRVDELLPAMTDFYSRYEAQFNSKFLYFKDIARVFPGREQQNDWIARSADDGYRSYVSDDENIDLEGINLRFEKGFGLVKQSGYLDVAGFLDASKQYFNERGILMSSKLDYSDLQLTDTGIQFQNRLYKQVIFCEGYQGAGNPWFGKLPFGNTKGELITVKMEGVTEQVIPNLGVWMLPVGDGRYKVGATFNWTDMSLDTTEEARKKLELELGQLTNRPYQLINQQAGIRPTTQDRRPMAGAHPNYQQLVIFNGLGTKGVMNAPWCASQLTDHLLNGTSLPADIDINRFSKYIC